ASRGCHKRQRRQGYTNEVVACAVISWNRQLVRQLHPISFAHAFCSAAFLFLDDSHASIQDRRATVASWSQSNARSSEFQRKCASESMARVYHFPANHALRPSSAIMVFAYITRLSDNAVTRN